MIFDQQLRPTVASWILDDIRSTTDPLLSVNLRPFSTLHSMEGRPTLFYSMTSDDII